MRKKKRCNKDHERTVLALNGVSQEALPDRRRTLHVHDGNKVILARRVCPVLISGRIRMRQLFILTRQSETDSLQPTFNTLILHTSLAIICTI